MQPIPQVPRNSLPQPQPHLAKPMRAVVSCELSVLEFPYESVSQTNHCLQLRLRLLQKQLEVEERRQDLGRRQLRSNDCDFSSAVRFVD